MVTAPKLTSGLTQGLTVLLLIAVVVLALPLMALVVFGLRFIVLIAFVPALIALIASPRLRHWLEHEEEVNSAYRGLRFPHEALVFRTHSWAAAAERGDFKVGIDDLAQRALGEVHEVSVLPQGKPVEQGETLATLRHGRRILEVKSPLAGIIAKANTMAISHPNVINQMPYGLGWLVSVTPKNFRGQRQQLLTGARAKAWFRAEVDRLSNHLAPPMAVGAVMQDGGELIHDIAAHMSDAGWQELREDFFA